MRSTEKELRSEGWTPEMVASYNGLCDISEGVAKSNGMTEEELGVAVKEGIAKGNRPSAWRRFCDWCRRTF